MWQETKDGLHKEFTFSDIKKAFSFIRAVVDIFETYQLHPRWQHKDETVQIWINTGSQITKKDRQLAEAIDNIYEKPMPNNVEKKTTAITEVKLYTDGGSRGNPGPSASGFVILNMQDKLLYKKGIYLGVTTNNQAEYNALKFGLDECFKRGAKIIDVYMDSLLIINQMNGVYKIKNKELLPINQEVKAGLSRFKEVKFTYIPRELNQQADAMVNEALDNQ